MKMKKEILALMILGCLGAGSMTVSAADPAITSVTGGSADTLDVTTNNNAVTISTKTGNVGSGEKGLVTGEAVYDYLHDKNLILGADNKATGTEGVYISGNYNQTTGTYVTVFGSANGAKEGSTVIGLNNNLYGEENLAGKFSFAAGYGNQATGNASTAIGYYSSASEAAVSLGCINKASGEQASAVGSLNVASGANSSAIGGQNCATGAGSVALGFFNIAKADKSTVVGVSSYVAPDATCATAVGYHAVAKEAGTVSFGHKAGDFKGRYFLTIEYEENGEIETRESSSDEPKEKGDIINGWTVTSCEPDYFDSDSFARLTNVADGKDVNDAATFGQIAAKGQTITGANNVLKDNNGDVIATFKLGSASFTAGDNEEISDDQVISVKADGKVEAGNTGIVTGGEVYDSISGIRSDLEGQINKVGAGAAALAMLHSEAFDPANKWNFAVGYGHYKNANAGALGAFYKPNADTTVTVASTMGNGNPMFGAGVSFKIGQRGQNFAPNASNAELAAEVNRLRVENEQIKAQMTEILRKLSLSETVNKSAR
jgi:trimeric autotransporter adhesin